MPVEDPIPPMTVYTSGSPGATAVVLVHGFSCSARWWDPVGLLLRENHRLLAVDLLGHGDSPRSPHGYAIETQALALVAALERFEATDVTLVGHSMGGHIAIEAAVRAPERIRGIVAVDMPPRLAGNDIGVLARLALLPGIGNVARITAPPPLTRRAMAAMFAPRFPAPRQLVGDSRRMARDSYAGSYRAMREYMDRERSIGARLADADAPKLVIWGELDQVWPLAHGREMAATASASFTTVPGVGHSPQVEAPDVVASAVAEFVASLHAMPTAKE
jgi:pimeloyl-ACP methyl ester carboxylesterase